MKYFKNPITNEVFAFEADGSQDEFIPENLVIMSSQEVASHKNPPLSPVEIKQRIVKAIQDMMDTEARLYGYDDIRSAVTYAEEPSVLKFQDEGRAFRAWRSLVWMKCYELLEEYQAGAFENITVDDVLEELPILQVNYRN